MKKDIFKMVVRTGVTITLTACITIPVTHGITNSMSNNSTNDNSNTVSVTVGGNSYQVTSDTIIELAAKNGELIGRNTQLEAENSDLKTQIENKEKEIEEIKNQKTDNENFNNEDDSKTEETGYVSLLSVAKIINACQGFEVKETGTMSLRGEDYANGFILHYYNNTEGVEFKLGGNYSKMKFKIGHLDETDKKGTFTLTYFLDGEIQPTITIQPEDSVKEEEIDLKNADILKLNWSNDKGYAEYGVAEVMVTE